MRYVRPKSYTPEDVATVRRLNRQKTAQEIADALGCPLWKVYHIRKREGISAVVALQWTPERIAQAQKMYMRDGRPSAEVGKVLGVSDKAVRKLSAKLGWKRENDAIRQANVVAALRRRAAERQASRPAPKGAPPPKPQPPKLVSSSDRDLIADFLARKGATVLPTMHARGITQMERALWAAGSDAPPTTWRKSA